MYYKYKSKEDYLKSCTLLDIPDYGCLSEKDFYPPSDDRVLESYIEDIDGGDNFADYCKYNFKLYENEDCYEPCEYRKVDYNKLLTKFRKSNS